MTTLTPIDYQSAGAPKLLSESLHEIGFAVIKNHGLDQAIIDRCYKVWSEFFAGEDKYNFPFDEATHSGFVHQALSETAKGFEVPDIKEFYHYYTWGRCPENIRKDTRVTFDMLTAFAADLLVRMEANMPSDIRDGLAMPLAEMIKDCPRTLFRLLHYPPLRGDEPGNAMRAAEHADIDMITVLPAATAEGLQVKGSDGEWIKVPTEKNWIIVNTGDMLSECTNHYYPSTLHRVVNPTGDAAKQSRLSMPLFLHANDNIRLSERYLSQEYLFERYRELGLKT